MKIKKGDTVQINSGKDKGRQGEVVFSFPKSGRLIIKGINLFKKHLKPSQDKKGGIIEKERPLSISKISLICPNCKKPSRIGYLVDKKGDKVRICKKCRQPIIPKIK